MNKFFLYDSLKKYVWMISRFLQSHFLNVVIYFWRAVHGQSVFILDVDFRRCNFDIRFMFLIVIHERVILLWRHNWQNDIAVIASIFPIFVPINFWFFGKLLQHRGKTKSNLLPLNVNSFYINYKSKNYNKNFCLKSYRLNFNIVQSKY